MKKRELQALRMAASGHVSGRLGEWPYLVAAFQRFGLDVPPTIGARSMQALARGVLSGLAKLET